MPSDINFIMLIYLFTIFVSTYNHVTIMQVLYQSSTMADNTDLLTHFGGTATNSLLNITNSNNNNENVILADPELDAFVQSYYINRDKLSSYLKKYKSNVSILSLNVQSLNAKIDELKILVNELAEHKLFFNIICVQETWLSNGSDTSMLQLENYTFIFKGKTCSNHGGVGMYIRNELTFNTLHLLNQSDIWEGLFVEISSTTHDSKLIIGSIYRPPRDLNENYVQFIDELRPILETLNNSKHDVILSGDYNIDLLKINEKRLFAEFYDTLLSHNYIPKITLPTRFSNTSATLIDNFFCNLSLERIQSPTAIITSPISDHLPYCIFLACKLKKHRLPKYSQVTQMTDSNLENFKQAIASADLFNLLDTEHISDPNHNYNIIQNVILKAKEECLPTKTVKYNKHKHKNSKWITKGIIKSIGHRDKLYVNLKQTKSDDPIFETRTINLRTYNKILKQNIRMAKRNYYFTCFQNYNHDIKNTWRTIK